MLAVASDPEASLVTLPGMADMALDGQFLGEPNPPSVDSQSYRAVEANYHAAGPLLRAIEGPIVDGLFRGKDKNSVVPTDGILSDRRLGIQSSSPKVKKFAPTESHTHFFVKDETSNYVLGACGRQDLRLSRYLLTRQVLSRS
jgi:hypothetical protein